MAPPGDRQQPKQQAQEMLQIPLAHDPSRGQYSRGLIWGQKRPNNRNFLHTLSHGSGAFREVYGLSEVSVFRTTRSWGQRDRVSSCMKGLSELGEAVKAPAGRVGISKQAAVSIENWHGNHELI